LFALRAFLHVFWDCARRLELCILPISSGSDNFHAKNEGHWWWLKYYFFGKLFIDVNDTLPIYQRFGNQTLASSAQ